MRVPVYVLVLLMLAGRGAMACSCANVQPFCNALPPFGEGTAVFVGVVKDVYPAESVDKYWRVLFPNAPESDDFEPTIQEIKDALLRVWRGVLLPEEEQRLKDARSERDLEMPLRGLSFSMLQRARLDVIERFSGPETDSFEVFSGAGGGDCGVNFHTGESYLVVASQDPSTGRWSTSICSRTRATRYADSDLLALRAWKKGGRLNPSAYGRVEDWTNRGNGSGRDRKPLINLRLQLRSGEEKREAFTDAEGRFRFDNLSHNIYEIDADLPGWRFQRAFESKRKIDLTKSGCSELWLPMEEVQGEVRGKVISSTGKLPGVLWIEAIPAIKNKSGSRTGGTKPDGSFVIGAIEPGDYVIALDVENPPTTENGRGSKFERLTPYPPMYFPGTSDRARAQVFHIERGKVLELPQWKLPEPGKERSITGVVVWPNQKPASTAKVMLNVASTGAIAKFVDELRSDATFTLYGLEGLDYRIRAAAYDPSQKLYYKGSVEVPAQIQSVIVVLELDGATPSDKRFFPEE